VLDTTVPAASASSLSIGVPNAVELTGTWVNVDGHRGLLGAARPAPSGVAPLVRTLEGLERALAAAEVAR
jgi:hypothetical protein